MTETDMIIQSLRHRVKENEELIAELRRENDRLFLKVLDLEELVRDYEKAQTPKEN